MLFLFLFPTPSGPLYQTLLTTLLRHFHENDEVEWLEEFDKEDQKELEKETETAIKEASEFYDKEVASYEND